MATSDASLFDLFIMKDAASADAIAKIEEPAVVVPEPEPVKKKKKAKKPKIQKTAEDKTDKDGGGKPRNDPGISAFCVERDKLVRIKQAIIGKNETRTSRGISPTTTCSLINDALAEFYGGVIDQFDGRFKKYMQAAPQADTPIQPTAAP